MDHTDAEVQVNNALLAKSLWKPNPLCCAKKLSGVTIVGLGVDFFSGAFLIQSLTLNLKSFVFFLNLILFQDEIWGKFKV